jgi:hypothetical protein
MMTAMDAFWNSAKTIKLGAFSGMTFQQDLALRWYPMDQNGIDWKDGNDYVGVSVYFESYNEPTGKVNPKLLELRKKAVDGKGYFFHIAGKKKDYIGFRNVETSDFSSIMYDLMDYFQQDED